MNERTLRLISAALAALGAGITGYLLYVRETGSEVACTTGGCETVQHSSYAEVLGVPVAALGLIGFLGLLVFALGRGEWARLGQATLALAGLAFSGYLLFIQLAVIDALCQWCLATDLLMTGIAALALLRLRIIAPAPPTAAPARPYPKRRPNGRRPAKRQTQRARAR